MRLLREGGFGKKLENEHKSISRQSMNWRQTLSALTVADGRAASTNYLELLNLRENNGLKDKNHSYLDDTA